MNLAALLFSLMAGLSITVLLPLLLIVLNNSLNLPALHSVLAGGLGIASMLTGVGLFIYCSTLFKLKGKGTPMPLHPPQLLVISGIYSVTRNPIYLGYWLILLGEFLVFGQLLLSVYLVLFMLGNHLYVVLHEEEELKKRFGDEYDRYMSAVPRYLPGLIRTKHASPQQPIQ